MKAENSGKSLPTLPLLTFSSWLAIENRLPYKELKDKTFAESIYAEVVKVDFDSNFIWNRINEIIPQLRSQSTL